jgi:hypothetical protein
MITAICHHWDGSSNSTLCRFATKGISKNIFIRPVLGPKINIEKSQVGPLKGPMMEFRKKQWLMSSYRKVLQQYEFHPNRLTFIFYPVYYYRAQN